MSAGLRWGGRPSLLLPSRGSLMNLVESSLAAFRQVR